MDTTAILAEFAHWGVSSEESDSWLASLIALENWLENRGKTLDNASERDLRTYLNRLIRQDKNSIDEILVIYYYYERSNRIDLIVYLSQIADHAQEIDDIIERVSEQTDLYTATRILDAVPQLPLGTDPSRFPAFTARFLDRLLATLPKEAVRRALDEYNENCYPVQFDRERELYLASRSLDEYLLASAKLEALKLRVMQRYRSRWKSTYFPKRYVERAVLHQELLSGVRHGQTIYVTLPPFLPGRYIAARLPEKRRYYTCGDPFVRAALLKGEPAINVLWCERCVNKYRHQFEFVLGKPVTAQIDRCALLGDTDCRFAISLEPVQEP